jgi:hypothetical protein
MNRADLNPREEYAFREKRTPTSPMPDPLLTFFRDRLSVPADQLGENPSLAFAAFQQFCTRERGRAYLYDDGANDLTRYETLFRNWNVAMGVPADFIEAVLHAQFIFESEGPGSFDCKEFFDAFRGFASGG